MNYEKAYKEALEKATAFYETKSPDCLILESIFPELAESDDERIRKEIISIVKSYRECCITEGNHRFDDCISWLEKQNEQIKIKQDMLTTFRNSVPEEWDFSKDKDLNEEVGRCFHNGMFPKYITPSTTITVSDLMRCASHFYRFGKEHKPADKVEPKFNVGDWIVQENTGVYKVIEICKSWYEVIDTEDNHYSISFDNKYMCHLWSIEYAKGGDVLAAHECLVLFKEIDGLNIKCYCTYQFMNNQMFHVDTLQNKTAFCPATKEQRDLLFQKMKEAGYEWDAEKKELIKNM